MRKIPVLFCVDVEPDERQVDLKARRDWEGFEESCRLLQTLRPRLEEATGAPVRFNWFVRMDPQVAEAYGSHGWAARRYGELFDALAAAGDELGLHVHAWRWDAGASEWVADYGDAAWVERCVQTSFEAFEAAFGRPCRSFRFGDRWISEEALECVERLGALYDLTTEPGRTAAPDAPDGERRTGAFPDYRKSPREPYRPARGNFMRAGGAGGRRLLLIPLTTVREPAWPAAPPHRRAWWRLRYGARSFMTLGPPQTPADFRLSLEGLLARAEATHLSMVMRSDEAASRARAPRLRANMEALASHPLAARLSFETPETAAAAALSRGRRKFVDRRRAECLESVSSSEDIPGTPPQAVNEG